MKIYLTKKKSDVNDIKVDNFQTIYLEDYTTISNISKARLMTDEIFENNQEFIDFFTFKGYKISWSWYSDIFQICLVILEIEDLYRNFPSNQVTDILIGDIENKYINAIKYIYYDSNITFKKKRVEVKPKIKYFIINFFGLFLSIVSIFLHKFKSKEITGSFTGDYIYKNSGSDFRLNKLYEKYIYHGIRYIEFIRFSDARNFFLNIFKRKKLGIYFQSFAYFPALFVGKNPYFKNPHNLHQSILYAFSRQNIILEKQILILEKIFSFLKIKNNVLISFSSRSAPLMFASKSLNIKTIGIMHGLQQKDYAVYEFIESYREDNKIGFDSYGVWSMEYLKYFRKYSKITNRENFFYSGLLRQHNYQACDKPFQTVNKKKIKVLLISEPLISVDEIIPFLKEIISKPNIEVGIKLRPMIKDKFYEALIKKIPEIKYLKVFDGKLEEVSNNYDIFLGSNSTAVIEAAVFGKLSLLVRTKKFGDYFDFANILKNRSLIVDTPNDLYNEIIFRVSNEENLNTIQKIHAKFFGENKDGTEWIIRQIKNQ